MEHVGRLRAFVRTVENGSFSAAARHLGTSPSSISRHVAELENELGIRLFHRTTRKISLTESGQLYHDHAVRILAAIDEASLALAGLDGAPSGVLRVTAPGPIARQLTALALPGFLERYPAIRVFMSVSDQVVDLVEAGYDAAIRVGRPRDSSLRARPIGSSRRSLCASPAYLDRHGRPATPADLAHHHCLLFRDHPGSNVWVLKGKGGTVDVRVAGPFASNNVDTLISAAVAGLGICLLPDWNMGLELSEGKLVDVLPGYAADPPTSPINVVFPYQRHVPPKLRVFVDYLVEHAAELVAPPPAGAPA